MLKRLQKITAAGDETRAKETATLQQLAEILEDVTVNVTGRVTPAGRYYGAISSAHVAAQLSAESGEDIDRRLVETSDPIREPGEYDIVLRLSTEITATVHVIAGVEE